MRELPKDIRPKIGGEKNLSDVAGRRLVQGRARPGKNAVYNCNTASKRDGTAPPGATHLTTQFRTRLSAISA